MRIMMTGQKRELMRVGSAIATTALLIGLMTATPASAQTEEPTASPSSTELPVPVDINQLESTSYTAPYYKSSGPASEATEADQPATMPLKAEDPTAPLWSGSVSLSVAVDNFDHTLTATPSAPVHYGSMLVVYQQLRPQYGGGEYLAFYCQPSYATSPPCGSPESPRSMSIPAYNVRATSYTAYVVEGGAGDIETWGPPRNILATSGRVLPGGSGPTSAGEIDGGFNPSIAGSQRCHADPINSFTGEFWECSEELGIPGTGRSLSVQRNISTVRRTVQGPFGPGSSLNYSMRLEPSPTEPAGTQLDEALKLRFVQENGSITEFSRSVDNTYLAPARVQAELVKLETGNFVVTRGRSEVFEFSRAGALLRAEDKNGQGVDVTYVDGYIDRITDDLGRFVEFSWHSERISLLTDNSGRTVEYSYSASGDLLEVKYPDGSSKAYVHDEDHRVTSIVHPNGGVTTNTYDLASRVVAQEDPLGRVTTFRYLDGTTMITDPTGARTVETYTDGQVVAETHASGTSQAATTTFTYGRTNQVTSRTDPLGRKTTFAYDERGNRTRAVDALGRVSTTTYDEFNNPLVVTNPAGEKTTFAYDERGNLTSVTDPTGAKSLFTVNPDGTIATTTDALGRVTSYTYDANGYVATATGPDGVVVTTRFDSLGRLVASTDPRGTAEGADPEAFTSTFSYDAAGRQLAATDPLGAVVATAYDAAGRPTTVTDPLGASTTREYDAAGQVTAVIDAAGNRTTFAYDGAGRVTSVTDPTGATTATEYDALGRAVKTIDPEGRVTRSEYDAGDRVVATIAPSGARTSYTYDAADQLLTVTDPLGAVTTTTYDKAGRPVTVTDADGRTTTTAYDKAGRATKVTAADSSTQLWAYDATGQVTTYTDAAGQVTTYAYDTAGRRASATDPAGRVTTYAYDRAGQLTTVTHPDGQSTTYAYDAAGRQTGVDYSDDTPDVATTFDLAGQPIEMVDGTGTTTYSYDDLGQVQQITAPTGTVGYEWDEAGRLVELTYPTGDAVDYTYNEAGQLTALTDWAGRDFTYTWTPDGQVQTLTYPNGVVTDYTHDDAGQPLAITTTNTAGVDLLELGYAYTPAGLLTDQTTTRSDAARAPPATPTTAAEVAWDAQARIEAITGHLGGTFAYDAAGSPTTLPGERTLTYDDARQLTTLTTPGEEEGEPVVTEFTYDDRGNRHTTTHPEATVTHGYDLANRLTSLTTGDQTTTYTYGADNLRATATTGTGADAVTETYTWDTTSAVPLLLTDATHAYLYGTATAPLAQIDLTDNDDVDYLHGDALGSIRTTTSPTGQVTGDSDYDAYGTPDNPTTDPAGEVTRFGYAGEYTDPTGYIYLRNRYYDPTTANFLTLDPLLDLTKDPYAYTRGNPLQYTDPLGLYWADNLGEWVGGFGDTITFGGTEAIRDLINYQMGYTDSVNYCSDFYTWGSVGGAFGGLATMPATGTTATAGAVVGIGAAGHRSAEHARDDNYFGAALYAGMAVPGIGVGVSQFGRSVASSASSAGGTVVRTGTWWSKLNKFADLGGSAVTTGTLPAVLSEPFWG
ncbi:RHS repeat-associated core domain-containing protein [Actinotalea sp. C106]|uniref:RHS repeat-associated core domain-containing protein n=1 Tax=Actinotalea sp. C106 TaxID=2908644 RepID=UPI0027E1B02D|nr:RHS repeat-associated core domain-containing protein [Actinotalea sp. C106]